MEISTKTQIFCLVIGVSMMGLDISLSKVVFEGFDELDSFANCPSVPSSS